MTSQSIRKNTVYNMVKTASSIAFPLITFPYASRVLLADGIGMISFGLSVVSYFALVASLGITTHAVRECALHRDNRERLGTIASEIMSINLCTTLFAYTLLALTLLLFRELDNYRLLIVLQSTTILLTTIGCDWLNTAMEDFRFITIRTVAFQLLSLILLFTLVHEPSDYMTYAAISVVASGGANVVNIWYRRRYCKVRFTLQMRWRHHALPILALFVMLLAQTVFQNIDMTMLGIMCGDRDVGLYSTAHKISGLISQLVISVFWVILPRLTISFENGDFEEINGILRKILGFYVALGFPLAVGTFMVADDAIIAFAGSDFADAALILRIQMIGFVVTLFGGSFLGNAVMLPSKNEQHFVIACVMAACVNAGLNYLFIPAYGTTAAAISTVASESVQLIWLAVKKDQRIRIASIGKLILSPAVGCVCIVGVCLAFSFLPNMWLRLILCVLSSVLVYAAAMIVTKNEFMLELLSTARSRIFRHG